jgi:hypothetical protein
VGWQVFNRIGAHHEDSIHLLPLEQLGGGELTGIVPWVTPGKVDGEGYPVCQQRTLEGPDIPESQRSPIAMTENRV